MRNAEPIAQVLRRHLRATDAVLEIGSGTGQHAVYFSRSVPFRRWQTSELVENCATVRQRLASQSDERLIPPIALDVLAPEWPLEAAGVDAVFSANTCHIMSWEAVQAMLDRVGQLLAAQGRLMLYGPFMIGGRHTSESNERFDRSLRLQAASMGIRNLADIDRHAAAGGMARFATYALPANNFLCIWTKGRSEYDEQNHT